MSQRIWLPNAEGGEDFQLQEAVDWPRRNRPAVSRVAFAAAHVVADPRGNNVPGAPAVIDWDSTLAFRRHLWSYGFGVADAMDTAQRGMGLDWTATQELIRRSGAEAIAFGGRLACGAGTDQLAELKVSLNDVVHAYEEQIDVVQNAGATVILMASRQLAFSAQGPEDYRDVYRRILQQVSGRVILHWLGPMFDPQLAGYWGSKDVEKATEIFLSVVHENAAHIDGVKVSLLDWEHEVRIRRALPDGIRLYTGDDFNYAELILGDQYGYSDALLGALAAIAPAAASALEALDRGDLKSYDRILAPTVPLARHIFSTPTPYYKTGIAFLAWLSGLQPGFTMVWGLQNSRSVLHLCETFRLADQADLLPDPSLAVSRMGSFLATMGVSKL